MRANRLYGDTVTLYHPDPTNKTVQRTVLHGVCRQQGQRALPNATGTRQGAALLLVIPAAAGVYGADYTLRPGDRVYPGAGPDVPWDAWGGFVPGADSQVAVVQYVLPLTLGGKPHHVEAGAWWNGTGTGVHSLTR